MRPTARRTLLLTLAALGAGVWLLSDRAEPNAVAPAPTVPADTAKVIALPPPERARLVELPADITSLVITKQDHGAQISPEQLQKLMDEMQRRPPSQFTGGGFANRRQPQNDQFGRQFGTGGTGAASGFGAGGGSFGSGQPVFGGGFGGNRNGANAGGRGGR